MNRWSQFLWVRGCIFKNKNTHCELYSKISNYLSMADQIVQRWQETVLSAAWNSWQILRFGKKKRTKKNYTQKLDIPESIPSKAWFHMTVRKGFALVVRHLLIKLSLFVNNLWYWSKLTLCTWVNGVSYLSL